MYYKSKMIKNVSGNLFSLILEYLKLCKQINLNLQRWKVEMRLIQQWSCLKIEDNDDNDVMMSEDFG